MPIVHLLLPQRNDSALLGFYKKLAVKGKTRNILTLRIIHIQTEKKQFFLSKTYPIE